MAVMDEPERLLSVPGNIGKESKGVALSTGQKRGE
jgi:hypothetical protein